MEVRIGISQIVKELELDLGDDVDSQALISQVEEALEKGEGVLWLTDKKGRKVGVPSSKLGYIDLGPQADSKKVGFGGPSPVVKSKK